LNDILVRFDIEQYNEVSNTMIHKTKN